jgi:filamentous hemagglutinin family protein
MKIKLLAVHIGLVLSSSALAEGIATDGTMGAAQILSGSSITIPQTLGSTVGNNLFHSFSDFNINTGQTVTFTGADNLQNVISRVTGNNKSVIDGTLKSEIKNADFYFINPNGITFNANASVDVPAAFHVTTADKMDFGKNGGVFYADKSKNSSLSSDSPMALGFLGTSKVNNGLIDFNGSQVTLNKTQTMDVVAGNITVENSTVINSEAGEVRFVVAQGENSVSLTRNNDDVLSLPETRPSVINYGGIKIDNAVVDTSGIGGGLISFFGGNDLIKNSKISSDNTGNINAIFGRGFYIKSNNLLMNNSSITFDVHEKGSNSLVTSYLDVVESFNINHGAIISSSSDDSGDSGNINIISGNFTIDGVGEKTTGVFSSANNKNTSAKAGKIEITSRDYINIYEFGQISSATNGQGNAGNILIKAKDIDINGRGNKVIALLPFVIGTVVNSSTTGIGNGGEINLIAENSFNLMNGAGIMNDVYGSYESKGGLTYIKANTINIDGKGWAVPLYGWNVLTGINSNSLLGDGLSGGISIITNNLSVTNSAVISSSSLFSSGKAGGVKVNSDNIKIDTQYNDYTGIFASTMNSSGNGGDLNISSKNIQISNGGNITTSTTSNSSGDAGTVSIKSESILINNWRGVTSQTTSISSYSDMSSSGNAGLVGLTTNILTVLNGGIVSSNSQNGNGGRVVVDANQISLDGSEISAAVGEHSKGQVGDIKINVSDKLSLLNNAKISVENKSVTEQTSPIITGDIHIFASDVFMDNSEITSSSIKSLDAGNINVNFSNRLNMENSFINTTANTGDGGAINVNGGDLIYLKDSGFKTTVSGEDSNGGDISVKAPILVMDTGLIQANAVSGNGGNINLALQALIPSANQLLKGGKSVDWDKSPSNIIQAASQSGVSGTVNNSAPQMNLSGVLVNIGNNNFDPRLVSQDYCAVNKGSSLSKKGKGGLPLRAKDLQVY